MKKQLNPLLFLLLALFVLQGTASANAGTALMWAGAFHLFIGNLIIGIFEGLVIGFVFRQSKLRSIGLMIVANYVSAWAMVFMLGIFKPLRDSITIYQIQWFMVIAMAIAFVFTVLIEWPFVHFSFHKKNRKLYLTLLGSLLIHIVSYSGLIYYYYGVSGKGLFENANIVSPSEVISEISADIEADIYYINNQSGNIYKLSLPENTEELFYSFENGNIAQALYLGQSNPNNDLCYDLRADIQKQTEPRNENLLIQKNILSGHKIDPESTGRNHQYSIWGFEAADYRSDENKQWTVYASVWADGGLILCNEQTEGRIYVSIETPFLSWTVYNPTTLDGDNIVFEWGNQICIYSRPTQKLALLAKGNYPIVVPTKKKVN